MSQHQWTERCKVSDLAGSNYMLRATDEPDAPWKLVTANTYEAWADAPPCVTITFEDGTQRHFLNFDDQVDIRPPA